MIWEQETVVIAMLTNNVEVSGTKCLQYWPLDAGASLVYGNFKVKTLRVDVEIDYTVSTLELKNLVVNFMNFSSTFS